MQKRKAALDKVRAPLPCVRHFGKIPAACPTADGKQDLHRRTALVHHCVLCKMTARQLRLECAGSEIFRVAFRMQRDDVPVRPRRLFPARRANEGSCVPSAGSSTQNAWLRYVAQSHGSAQTSPFRAGLRFRFQFAKYKTACRTGLALPFRLFCSDYKRAAFPMQRLRLTSTTTGKKKQGYPAAALCAYWGKYGILWSRLPRRGRRLVHTNCIRLLFAFLMHFLKQEDHFIC